MSNFSPAMNYVPGPSSQQPGSQQPQYPAHTMQFPQHNPHLFPNPTPLPNSPPNPNLHAYPIPSMLPNNMFPNQPSFQTNPNTPSNHFPNNNVKPNQNVPPNPNISANPIMTLNQNVPPNPNMSANPNVTPNQNVPPNPNMSANPIVTPNQSVPPNPNMSANPNVTPNQNVPPNPNISVNQNVTPNPTEQPTHVSPNPDDITATSNLSPNISMASNLNESPAPKLPNTNVSPKPSLSPNKDNSPDINQSSPPTEPTPSTSTLPNPNLSLAGKLAENVRRSKRKNDTSSESASKKSKTLPAKIVYDDYDDDDDDEEESECPKEYVIENAYTDRVRFYNHVAKTVYRKDFARFKSKDEFQKYLAGQQKWRWEVNNIVVTLDTRVHNLCVNQNAGIAQNVQRYSTIPLNCKSDDVRRCEKTAKELEKMIFRIEQTKEDMDVRWNLLFDEDLKPNPGEVDFMDEIVQKVDRLKDSVDTFHNNVTETLQNICKRFTTESVEAAEIRRQKRRKKENLKKKRKMQEKQLEKKVIDALLRITSTEVTERILTGSDATKISVAEIDSKELIKLSKGTNETDLMSLHTILVREYLDEEASKLVKDKLAKCC